MRLIDSNALENVLQKRSDELMDEKQQIMSGALMGAICYVLDAPTIEPVKRGEWIGFYDEALGKRYGCSLCACSFGSEENFCPNCGADMGTEGQHESD